MIKKNFRNYNILGISLGQALNFRHEEIISTGILTKMIWSIINCGKLNFVDQKHFKL